MSNLMRSVKLSESGSHRSAEEIQIRRDLAACYRLVAHFGWDDLLATHLSAKIPGEEAFLINPVGLLFDEITASSLVKVNLDGDIIEDTPYAINRAGFVIHSAVHAARKDAGCVIHLHTRDGVAVASLSAGILPLNQTAMMVRGTLATHEYEGVAVDEAERERLARDLGDHQLMLLRNHGTLAVGASVAHAFFAIYMLEWACTVQIRALSTGLAQHPAAEDVIARTAASFGLQTDMAADYAGSLLWPAMLRKLDRTNPGYAD